MPENNVDFEKVIEELEKTVEKLENGDCGLEESIKLFEKGIELSKTCRDCLENARKRIITLTDAENEALKNEQ